MNLHRYRIPFFSVWRCSSLLASQIWSRLHLSVFSRFLCLPDNTSWASCSFVALMPCVSPSYHRTLCIPMCGNLSIHLSVWLCKIKNNSAQSGPHEFEGHTVNCRHKVIRVGYNMVYSKKILFVSLCSGLVKFCTAFISVVSPVKLLLMLHGSHTLHVPLTKLGCNYCWWENCETRACWY